MDIGEKHFDLIVIGGGATGSGIALDATLRGLKTLLVEKNDFAEGTSSRSTKLVHGGVRYLEAAVKKLDIDQFNLVKEGLKERYRLLKNAPHLAHSVTLITPLYKWYEISYMFVGLALYDLISGKRRLGKSQIVGKDEISKIFPYVKKEGLKGGVRYFDGAFNDSRMAIALLQSAKEKGCNVKNYTEVMEFVYEDSKITGVRVKDKIAKKIYDIKADFVVNASGPFVDRIRKLDDKNSKEILETSSGIHIVLDKKFLPNDEGIMIPKTEDGRVLFMLPYLDKCLVGTTDEKEDLQDNPKVKDKDIEYLLRHIKKYFSVDITKNDILSSWSGLRPLVVSSDKNSTKELVREHYIEESKSGLVSIVGGKWTTYRKMAEEVIDYISSKYNRKKLHTCKTKSYKLVGSQENLSKIKDKLDKLDLNKKAREHLLSFYGDRALCIAEIAKNKGFEPINENYPVLKAEIHYSVEKEFVKKPLDFLVRRVNLGLIDKEAAKSSLLMVCKELQDIFGWSEKEYVFKLNEAKSRLESSI